MELTRLGVRFGTNRFVGFVLGIISYMILTSYHFKQPVTMKISVQLLLCFLILMVQIFWVEKEDNMNEIDLHGFTHDEAVFTPRIGY